MPKKKRTTDDNPSVIVSRVQREAAEGKRPKGEKETSIIRSRVLHGAVETSEPTAARKSARKAARSTTPRTRSKRTSAHATPTSTET